MTIKSPFFVMDEFISPLMCEDIIFRLNNLQPNTDIDNNPLLTVKENRLTEIRVLPLLEELTPTLEAYYGYEHLGYGVFEFEWYPANFQKIPARCANSNLVGQKWVRTNNRDFEGIIFLNDYQDRPPFDKSFEVVGGKLGFPTHNFSIMPQRGQLVIYPGSPHFVNATSDVLYGDLNQIRFHITAKKNYDYNPALFPGNYTQWF